MLQCGADYYEDLTTEKVDTLIDKLRASGKRSTYLASNRQEI
jgi:NADH-quinone oxidoreductase subunit E